LFERCNGEACSGSELFGEIYHLALQVAVPVAMPVTSRS
jgi:hypothetical protein